MNISNALEKVMSACRLRHLSWSTEETYCGWVKRYAAWVRDHPEDAPSRKMEGFLTKLAKQEVSASTQNQAFNALLFLYAALKIEVGNVKALRAKRPARIRDCPARPDVLRLLQCAENVGGYPTRLIVHLLYGCGLRVTEPLNMRLRDVVLSESRLIIRGAKGDKDRVVSIPCSLLPEIEQQMKVARAVWTAQQAVPVPLPGLLSKKYPSAPFAAQWAFLFPARRPVAHPRTGEMVRWRCHEANVQRCVRAASRKANLDGTITPHCLRHAYATHAMQLGSFVRDVQVVMGHASLETTMAYLHAETGRVSSPLDAVPNIVPFSPVFTPMKREAAL